MFFDRPFFLKKAKNQKSHRDFTDDKSGNFHRACERLSRFPPFDPKWYSQTYPDVADSGVAPHYHWLAHGEKEGRLLYDQKGVARHVGSVRDLLDGHRGNTTAPRRDVAGLRVGLLCSSMGNPFMLDIARQLAEGLRRHGVSVSLIDENHSIEKDFDARIIAAPHEFFYMNRGDRWKTTHMMESSFMLSTEQIQTTWYMQSLPYLMRSKGVIDMYYHSMRLISRSGIPAIHYVPDPDMGMLDATDSYHDHPLFEALPEQARAEPNIAAPLSSRPLDICYFGAESEHRDNLISRAASVLAEFKCFICNRRMSRGPLVGQDKVLISIASHASAVSKITLNLHRDRFGAFEWYRIVRLAMCAGSLVLSEKGLPVPGFTSGEHYLESDGRHMPEMIHWLLKTQDGQKKAERIRQNASTLIRSNHASNAAAARVLSFLVDNK